MHQGAYCACQHRYSCSKQACYGSTVARTCRHRAECRLCMLGKVVQNARLVPGSASGTDWLKFVIGGSLRNCNDATALGGPRRGRQDWRCESPTPSLPRFVGVSLAGCKAPLRATAPKITSSSKVPAGWRLHAARRQGHQRERHPTQQHSPAFFAPCPRHAVPASRLVD